MKIAITGKGGTGKTMVSGALARQLGREGHQVVAIDADPNPNLGISLGLDPDITEKLTPIINALLADGSAHKSPAPDPEDLLKAYGVDAPDGVRLVATGLIERPSTACLCCETHMMTQQFFGQLKGDGRVVVADLEAGLTDLIWAKPSTGDVVIAVADPSMKAVEIARRARSMAESMGVSRVLGVANRSTPDDAARLEEVLGVEVVGIPDDPIVRRADFEGAAPTDLDASSPAIVAIGALAESIQRG